MTVIIKLKFHQILNGLSDEYNVMNYSLVCTRAKNGKRCISSGTNICFQVNNKSFLFPSIDIHIIINYYMAEINGPLVKTLNK